MDRFFGFDLGDAESAISWLGKDDQTPPKMIKVCEAESFITACATLRNGELQIGEQACYKAETDLSALADDIIAGLEAKRDALAI